jgi:hypothetical protein
MDNAKYIVFESEYGCEAAIIFPNYLYHSGVANGLNLEKDRVYGAGEVMINKNGNDVVIHCFGKSTSLTTMYGKEIKSRGLADELCVIKCLYPNNYNTANVIAGASV